MNKHAPTLAIWRSTPESTTTPRWRARRRSTLAVAIAEALSRGFQCGVQAAVSPAEFDLSGLDGRNGVVFFRESPDDRVGYSAAEIHCSWIVSRANEGVDQPRRGTGSASSS